MNDEQAEKIQTALNEVAESLEKFQAAISELPAANAALIRAKKRLEQLKADRGWEFPIGDGTLSA